jgi:tetratricopeptide (TPR) repeat protein
VLLFVALLAKEVAIAGLVLVPAAWLLVPGRDGSADARRALAGWVALVPLMLALLAAAAAYLLLREAAGTIRGTMVDIGPATAVAALARATAHYLLKLVVPWPQSNLVTWEMLPAWTATALAAVAAGGLAAWAAGRWFRRGDGVPLLALAWVLATLAPSLWIALVYTTTGPVSDRYLYLPSVGLALGAGWLVQAALAAPAPAWRRSAAAVVAAAILVAGIALSLQRGAAWTSNLALWSDATQKLPDRAFPWISLARAWREAGEPERALEAYRRALVSEPVPRQRARAMAGIAELHLDRGELEQAQREFDRAEREDPSYAYPTFGLGLVGMAKARAAEGTPGADVARGRARYYFESLLAEDPRKLEARLALAQLAGDDARALARAGARTEALERYAVAMRGLDEMLAWMPAAQLEAYLRVTGEHLERDAVAYRAQLGEEARRLDTGRP